MPEILLTGGSGFIGEYFQQSIPGTSLVNLDLQDPPFKYTSTFVKGDIRKEEDVRKAIEGKGIKTIISLAAKHHDFGIGHDEYFDTNEEGTAVICKVAAANNIKEIVFFSSVAVYGLNAEASTETRTPNPDSP